MAQLLIARAKVVNANTYEGRVYVTITDMDTGAQARFVSTELREEQFLAFQRKDVRAELDVQIEMFGKSLTMDILRAKFTPIEPAKT